MRALLIGLLMILPMTIQADDDVVRDSRCNEMHVAVQMLCNAKSGELYTKHISKHDHDSKEFWYLLGQVEGATQAHEEILKVMNWPGYAESRTISQHEASQIDKD